MKKRKNELISYLKIGTLLITVSLLLWNCQKEEIENTFPAQENISVEEIKTLFDKEFNTTVFPRLKNPPIWEQIKASEYEGKAVYEIPMSDLSNIDYQKSTSISYDKLIAFKNDKNTIQLNILHFYSPKKENVIDNELSLGDLNDFDGFISFYNLDKKPLLVKRYIKGQLSKKEYNIKENNNNDLMPMAPDESCETFYEKVYTRHSWFIIFNDGSTEEIHSEITWETIPYESCGNGTLDEDIGNNADDNQGVTVISETTTIRIINNLTNPCASKIFEQLKAGIYKYDPNKPDAEFITPTGNLTLSQKILFLFSETYKTNYTIQNGTTNNTNASTFRGVTTINSNYLQNATKLSIARTMIHEQVHAYINNVFRWKTGFKDYSLHTKLHEFALSQGITDNSVLHHEFMADFVEGMASSLYKWDSENGGGNLGWEYYKAMAYGGLGNKIIDASGAYVLDSNDNYTYEDTASFIREVPLKADRDIIKKIISDETTGNTNAKGKKC